ncbi:hypothetical protein ISF_01626 [Cordyceps fumosorosea ARSEF 2679]|uniref:Ca3427-like PBP 2 domain-containing protein n=1 Tax=Cordyceps fumosorosea (strain ARSEF 2679) TaxID=1081104 RepID=A0A168DFL9_CORFA|nr:hypothetical protein ISF_01626 [Cordyceps fumosorosea ARSEF 2679]OAA72553.1 hypothetical protein ISF_01626 [Cordyceps fumosorosea ARSEF 2679]
MADIARVVAVANHQPPDRPLQHIKAKGRPVSQCNHCRSERKNRSAHVKCQCGKRASEGGSDCGCFSGQKCKCATKKSPKQEPKKLGEMSENISELPSPVSTLNTASPAPTSISADLQWSEITTPASHFMPLDGLAQFDPNEWMTSAHFDTSIIPSPSSKMAGAPLRIGYVPEHFSTPLYFAQKHYGLDAVLTPFPSGTGAMITALRAKEIDVGIGLTEGWIAGLGKEDLQGDGGYRLVGTYGGKIGVSRIGSGSYVMGFVLADQHGWLTPPSSSSHPQQTSPFSDTVVLNTFAHLRDAVNSGAADFFLWEHFTQKRYFDAGEIRRVGEIYTPWSSWKVVASTDLPAGDARLAALFEKLDAGVAHFNDNAEEAVRYICTSLDYTEADAREWLKTVRFPARTRGVKAETVEGCVAVLQKAGVLVPGKGLQPGDMVI